VGSGGGRALFSQSEYLELFEQDGAERVSRKFFMIDDALHTIADIFFVDWMSKEFTDKTVMITVTATARAGLGRPEKEGQGHRRGRRSESEMARSDSPPRPPRRSLPCQVRSV
jgi:hypothetical protein